MMYILTTDCHDEGAMEQIQLSQDQNIQLSSQTVIFSPSHSLLAPRFCYLEAFKSVLCLQLRKIRAQHSKSNVVMMIRSG